jgi:hypothetical protein
METLLVKPPMRVITLPAGNYGRGAGEYSSAVVCHIAECATLSQLDNWFQNPTAGVSSNYGIGPDGEIHQYVDSIAADDYAYVHGIVNQPDDAFRALWAARGYANPNLWAPGIEHVGYSSYNQITGAGTCTPPPAPQWDASVWLTAWLCATCGITPAQATILGHYEVNSIDRPGCPGWDAPTWTRYVDAVRGLLGLPPEGTP